MQTEAKICVFFVLLAICHTNDRRLNGQLDEPMILPFVCNHSNSSSVTIYTENALNYIIYDVAQNKCTNVSNYFNDRIESCVFNGKNLNLTFKQLKWLDKGNYTALDDQGFILDSIFVAISDNGKSTQQVTYSPFSSRPKDRDALGLHLGLSVVVIFVAACLVIIAVLKYRQRKARWTTTNKFADRNEGKDTSNSFDNVSHVYEEAPSLDKSISILTKVNNEHDSTELSHNSGQDKAKQNEEQMYPLDITSPKITETKLLIQSNLFSAENLQSDIDHIYNNLHTRVHLQHQCLLDGPYPTSSECIAGSSFEYENVLQRNSITAQALAPDPNVIEKSKGQVKIADSTLRHKKVRNKSSSLVDPSTLYAKVNKKKTTKSHYNDSLSEHSTT
ncbi:hypothetical protein ACJMK2_024906 [Sinanodonta woodiana]|uniref:Uncharacterized protein n=1 Tax=Sinanodonta woodiana TaxID=1069815 RepID=A0ABD3XGE4_SINWO